MDRGFWMTVAGSSVAAGGAFLPMPIGPIIGVVGAALSILGGYIQARSAPPYHRTFEPADWRSLTDRGAELVIPAAAHRKGAGAATTVEMLMPTGHYAECGVAVEQNDANDVTVGIVAPPFAGRVTIR